MPRTRPPHKHLMTNRGVLPCGSKDPICVGEAITDGKMETRFKADGQTTYTILVPNRDWSKFKGIQCPTCDSYYRSKMNELDLDDKEHKGRDRQINSSKHPKVEVKPWQDQGKKPRKQYEAQE